MNLNGLACAVSARFSDAIASPFALPTYIVLRIIAAQTLSPETVTIALSDAAMIALILMAVEQSRQGRVIENGVKEIVRVDERIDERVVEEPK